MTLGGSIAVGFWTCLGLICGIGLVCDLRRWWRWRLDERHALADLAASQPIDVPLEGLYQDADDIEREFWASAERYERECDVERDLETAFRLPCAPEPREFYCSGNWYRAERRAARARREARRP